MDKTQLIAAIGQLNPSASRAFLNTFSMTALQEYLDHLELILEPRGRQSTWRRSGETPAAVTRPHSS